MANETVINVMTADDLLHRWQEHRRLTRRVIEAFPEDKLFHFSIGGMRTFAEYIAEFLGMAVPTVVGISTGKWAPYQGAKAETKAELLALWDQQTADLNEKFPQIPADQFSAIHKAFEQWEMPGIKMIDYAIDNEIHHRGQGYVYLRALGIEPPPFWDRH